MSQERPPKIMGSVLVERRQMPGGGSWDLSGSSCRGRAQARGPKSASQAGIRPCCVCSPTSWPQPSTYLWAGSTFSLWFLYFVFVLSLLESSSSCMLPRTLVLVSPCLLSPHWHWNLLEGHCLAHMCPTRGPHSAELTGCPDSSCWLRCREDQ